MSSGNLVGVDQLDLGGMKSTALARAYGGESGNNTFSHIFSPAVQRIGTLDIDFTAISSLLTFLAIIRGLIFLWKTKHKQPKKSKNK